MTKKVSTKRALLLSALSLLLCMSMLIGSTFAWFTDSVVSGSNVIQSGNLDIEVQYTLDGENWADLAGATDLFKKGLWEPGHTEVVVLKVENKGSLALKYVANMNIINEIVGKTKDGANIVLSDILTVSTLTFAEAGVDPVFGINIAQKTIEEAFKGESNVGYGNAVIFKAGNVLEQEADLLPGEIQYVAVKVDMAETVGNEANHDGENVPSIEFGLNVLATQYTYESDSFGNQYDDLTLVHDGASFVNAVDGGNIVLTKDVAYYNTDPNGQLILEATDAINFNGDGNTITVSGSDPSVGNHGYVGFVPPAGEDVTVSNLTVSGNGFVEMGHWGIGGGTYVANNLVLTNMVSTLANGDKGFTLGCTFCHYGTATLNNCTMTGAQAMIDGVIAVDAGFCNGTTTTINGGEYGVIYCWSHSVVTINDAEVDYIYAAPIKGSLTIAAGTHVGTIDLNYGTAAGSATAENLAKLVIEEGAIVDEIVFNGKTYTQAEWLAR